MVINGNPTPTIVKVQIPLIYPNVADLYRGKTCQSASDVAAHRLGHVKAYFTVREVLAEASTVRPEPFGSETCRRAHVESLKAELLTAEGGRRWRALARA